MIKIENKDLNRCYTGDIRVLGIGNIGNVHEKLYGSSRIARDIRL